ncbi:MAG: hypothetical protein BroJett040_00660 [Oligoflexia bacterium]|nr:MAG: hypothetical protein BroJett040_00660 [Oligoflexia bacterium]
MKRILVLLFVFVFTIASESRSRKIESQDDEVSIVKTSLGIATKIILPENPTSQPIIGDIGAFRIEPIENGYAVKPLRVGARTNLFISTSVKTYSVKLITVGQEDADYITYLYPKHLRVLSGVWWRDFRRKVKSEFLTLETRRIGHSPDGYIHLEVYLKSYSEVWLKPDWFWIFQGSQSCSIHSLMMSSKKVDSDRQTLISMSISQKELLREMPLVFEVKYQDGIKLEVPRELLWRR